MAESKTVKKDDLSDLGVPMLKGSDNEPTGPEDALGEGPKRGDYTDRIGPSNYHPHEAKVVDGKSVLDPQRPRAEEIGEAPGKGGVNTAKK
jgi:hypothetical protein